MKEKIGMYFREYCCCWLHAHGCGETGESSLPAAVDENLSPAIHFYE